MSHRFGILVVEGFVQAKVDQVLCEIDNRELSNSLWEKGKLAILVIIS